MDRAPASGAGCTGSSPVRGTTVRSMKSFYSPLSLSPQVYLSGRDLREKVSFYLSSKGSSFLFIGEREILSLLKPFLEKVEGKFVFFRGENCWEEVERIISVREKEECVVGIGGGKALDCAKLVSKELQLPLVTIPTSAATCSAFSSISALYDREGRYLKTLETGNSPSLTLVDFSLIGKAPPRLLASGMADSLAKWYEGKLTVKEDLRGKIALKLSSLIREIIFGIGIQAMEDSGKGKITPELEKIIETNILLTGIVQGLGGKSFRSNAAHALNYALTHFPSSLPFLHGERVGVGILFLLHILGEEEEISRLSKFYSRLSLPRSLRDLGVKEKDLPRLEREILKEGSGIYRLPFQIKENQIREALKRVYL